MTPRKWRRVCIAGLAAVLAFSTGCDDLVRNSIRDGVFSFVSGGISQNGAISNLLNSVFTGNLFGDGTNTTNTTTGA